jgi:hypothetical protein
MTQLEWILDALKRGPLTPVDALQGCGCFRLAARIRELRDFGHPIETRDHHLPSGKVVAEYHLKENHTC